MNEPQAQSSNPPESTREAREAQETHEDREAPPVSQAPREPAREAGRRAPAPTPLADDPRRRSPALACMLSAMPGLGHVYLGYIRLGFVHAIVIATILTLMAAEALGPLITMASVFLAFFWLYGIIDAGRRATLINQALLGRLDLELPETVGEPGLRGSIPGGVAIIGVGVLLLSNTLFGVSLVWIEDWWPAAVIGFGLYLVYQAVRDRREGSGRTLSEATSDTDSGEV